MVWVGSYVDSHPQKCFLDNIESWSTNEVTINWNAPLAWVTGYLTELSDNGHPGGPGSGCTSR